MIGYGPVNRMALCVFADSSGLFFYGGRDDLEVNDGKQKEKRILCGRHALSLLRKPGDLPERRGDIPGRWTWDHAICVRQLSRMRRLGPCPRRDQDPGGKPGGPEPSQAQEKGT